MKKSFVLGQAAWLLSASMPLMSTVVSSTAAESPTNAWQWPQSRGGSAVKEEFAAVANAVVRLLETGDAAAFAKSMAPSIYDWRAVADTNRNTAQEDPLGADWQKSLDRQRQRLESSAKQMLARAVELKLDFSAVRLNASATPPKSLGTTRYKDIQAEGESLRWAEKLEVTLTAEPLPNHQPAERMRGEYKVALASLLKFPGGWRCSEAVRWVSFPTGVADEKVRQEMAIQSKIAARESINQNDDPALRDLGEAIARFIRAADANLLEKEAMLSADAIWALFQNLPASSDRPIPSREEVNKQWAIQRNAIYEPAQAMLALMQQQGIDLKEAEVEVKQVTIKRLNSQVGTGTLEGLNGSQFAITLSVKSSKLSRTGKPLAGEYIVAALGGMRIGGRWLISEPVRWDKLPPGVVDDKTRTSLEFEAYVAEHRSLPPGMAAPDVEFVLVNGERKGSLKELHGKVVILDFWATWCGPCQEPMASLQKYRDENPDWKERVAIVSLSIDDTLKVVRSHLDKRGWTNSFNVWAGEGGWQSPAAKAFRVRGVPTCYVIDAEGKIVKAGHPMSVRAPEVVNRLLK